MALLAQHPADRVHHVRLPAAVRPHDAGRAGAAERDHGAFAERLKANDFYFSQLKQGVPFCRVLPLRDAPPRKLLPRQTGKGPRLYHAKRDDFPFLEGRFFDATFLPVTDRNHTRLAGSRSEAQPPGAKMAVREESVTWAIDAVKPYSSCCGPFPHATSGSMSLRHNFRIADHSKVGQTSQYKGVNQELCAVRIGAGATTISASPVATS